MSELFEDTAGGQNTPEFSVSEISGAVKRTIEGAFGRVRVRGEVGRVMLARSGHLYFDVKDDRSVLAAVSWKGQVARLSIRPEEGMEVIVTGKITTFGSQSKYQLNVDDVVVAGEGALMAMLEKRKKLLAAEGLFAPERKQKLPFLPETIGVITSPSGAVIRDILHRLRDRFARHVLVWPVAVQGDGCAAQVAAAIKGFNALPPNAEIPRPDLLIVARGGGSIEDLWGFNEEIVARAAAASQIPLISAVGHETDTTLIDYVSDLRAPTPTAAAEHAVPVRLELLSWTQEQGTRLLRSISNITDQRRQRLGDLSRLLPRKERLLDGPRQRLDVMGQKLPTALVNVTQRQRLRLSEHMSGLRPQVISRQIKTLHERLDDRHSRLLPSLSRNIALQQRAFSQTAQRLDFTRITELQTRHRKQLDDLSHRLNHAMNTGLMRQNDRLDALERMRQTLGYRATLKRGYAVMRDGDTVITSVSAAKTAATLQVEFADGSLDLNGSTSTTAKTSEKPTPPKRAKTQKPEQGSLF